MEFLKVQILSNKFKPTKYSIPKSFKEQIFESGEDSKIIKNSTSVNQTTSQITQQHDGRSFLKKLSSRNLSDLESCVHFHKVEVTRERINNELHHACTFISHCAPFSRCHPKQEPMKHKLKNSEGIKNLNYINNCLSYTLMKLWPFMRLHISHHSLHYRQLGETKL